VPYIKISGILKLIIPGIRSVALPALPREVVCAMTHRFWWSVLSLFFCAFYIVLLWFSPEFIYCIYCRSIVDWGWCFIILHLL